MRRRLSAMAAVLALGLMIAMGSGVAAQDEPTEVPVVTEVSDAVSDAADTVDEETDDSGRWGLLGLLGLAGLAGLLKRPTQTVVQRDTTDRTGGSTQR